MFKIGLKLAGFSKVGIAALDLRRKFGLPDGTHFWTWDRDTVTVDVPESFARAHFGPQTTTESEEVHVGMLLAGELVETPQGDKPMVLAKLTPTRGMELFLAARMRRLRDRVQELEDILEKLEKGQPAEEDDEEDDVA